MSVIMEGAIGMRYEVTIDGSKLSRRVLRFQQLDRGLVLDEDCDEERDTTRHKWRIVRWWSRLNRRDSTMERREVPQAAIDEALAQARADISYR